MAAKAKRGKGNCEPARAVAEYFGGAQALARLCGRSRQCVYYWTWPRPRGSGGVIPARVQRYLLARAREMNLDLRAEDFYDASRLRALLLRRAAAAQKPPARRRGAGAAADAAPPYHES